MLNFDKVDNEYKQIISVNYTLILLHNRARRTQKNTTNDIDILYDLKKILTRYFTKMFYSKNLKLFWNNDKFSEFPYEMQEYVQKLEKHTEDNIMSCEISEEDLFYLRMKFEKFIDKNPIDDIIIIEN